MILLTIPLLTFAGICFFWLTEHERRWKHDKQRMQREIFAHHSYLVTGQLWHGWQRYTMPGLPVVQR